MMVVKVVEDIFIPSTLNILQTLVTKIQKQYKLDTTSNGPVNKNIFGLKINQKERGQISVHADEK